MPFTRRVFLVGVAAAGVFWHGKPKPKPGSSTYSNTYSNTY